MHEHIDPNSLVVDDGAIVGTHPIPVSALIKTLEHILKNHGDLATGVDLVASRWLPVVALAPVEDDRGDLVVTLFTPDSLRAQVAYRAGLRPDTALSARN